MGDQFQFKKSQKNSKITQNQIKTMQNLPIQGGMEVGVTERSKGSYTNTTTKKCDSM